MKNSNAKKMAVYIALLTSSIAGAVVIIFTYSPLENQLPVLVASVLVIFASVYLMVYFLLTDFFFQKISPIYKTISGLSEHEKKIGEELETKEAIDDLNKEMVNWASGKTRELDQLKEMENYRREFLGNVSHEMKTPIFNVQGYIMTLLDGGIDDPAINKLYLQRAEKSINRLINIVSDLDTISGLDSGEVPVKFGTFDMVRLAREVIELQEMRAQKQGVRLRLKKNFPRPIPVHADRKKIQEVLINLIINSIKYSRKNGLTTIDIEDMEDDIMVVVKDNGMGISNDDLPRIFERFYRVDKSRSRNQGGTGLGLAIVKHIIEAHNQTINVSSTENEGTSFSFTLMKGLKEPENTDMNL
jgi:two-component system, OmpR family, phosphate regulon sensor histidine kinase PhoR